MLARRNILSINRASCFICFLMLALFFFQFEAYPAPSDYYDTAQKVYIGYYQRPADPGGLLYWAGRLDATNGNLNEIIEAYANSAESQALYGTIDGSNIGTVVDSIYMALFNRLAEAEGKAYYVNGFNEGRFTPATIMLNVLYGAQNQDLASVSNKVAASTVFTRTIDPDLDGANFQATYAGDADAIATRRFLTLYATSVKVPTQAEATAYIQNSIADPGDPIKTTDAVDPTTAGYNELGSGYDVFTAYADAEYVRNQALDLDALNRAGKLSKFVVDTFDLSEHKGTTINEYAESYTASLGIGGSYKFFSAEVNSVFSRMSNVTTQWSFATLQINHLVHGLTVERMPSEILRGYLLNQARADIETAPPRVLFEMFGTHIIGRLLVGGRLDYNLTALISEQQRKTEIGLYAEARLKSGFSSVNVHTDFEWESFRRDYVSDERTKLSTVGGQASALAAWTDNDYTKWVATVWDNPVFCSFSADPWLVPIWELAEGWNSSTSECAPVSRCEEIRSAYIEYAAEQKYKIFPAGFMFVNSFESDREGWSEYGAGGFNWKDENSEYSVWPFGAHLEAIDGSISPWYFQASSTTHSGDMSQFYGGELTYQFRWKADTVSNCLLRGKNGYYYGDWWKPDVQIYGRNQIRLGYFFEYPPDTYQNRLLYYNVWREYSVPVEEQFGVQGDYRYGWVKYCEGRPGCYAGATRDEILGVLKDVESVSIRGEYCLGSHDRGMLDEVILRAPDTDGDGVFDVIDNCPNVPNAGQEDGDGDDLGDACEALPQGPGAN